MDLNAITQAISLIGFPVIACYYIYTDGKKKEEKDRQDRKEEKELWLKELTTQRELYKSEIYETRKSFSDKMDQFATTLTEISTSVKDNNIRLDSVEGKVESLTNIIVKRIE